MPIGNTFQSLFLLGANALVATGTVYGPDQQAAGFTEEEWDTLTSTTCWTKSEIMKIPSILSAAVSITLRIGGLPAVPLPGAFVAATICKLVAPCNRLLAAANAPESFDAMSASGITGDPVEIITTKQQMYSLVTYFSSAQFGALENITLSAAVQEVILEQQTNPK